MCTSLHHLINLFLVKLLLTRTIISSGLQFTHWTAWKYLNSVYENADFNCFYFILMTLKAVFALALKKNKTTVYSWKLWEKILEYQRTEKRVQNSSRGGWIFRYQQDVLFSATLIPQSICCSSSCASSWLPQPFCLANSPDSSYSAWDKWRLLERLISLVFLPKYI